MLSFRLAYSQVPNACFSLVEPSPVEGPELVAASPNALNLLDIPESEIARKDFPIFFSGSLLKLTLK
jgi:hypothetical protein